MGIKAVVRELVVTLPVGALLLLGLCAPHVTGNPSFGTLPAQVDVEADTVMDAVTEQKVTLLTLGRDCWDPSTGQLAADIVVRWTETRRIEVIPFTEQAWERAQAGEFETLAACA